MKKGLRLLGYLHYLVYRQNRRPDEEGIKTQFAKHIAEPKRQNRRPDEEGIKT